MEPLPPTVDDNGQPSNGPTLALSNSQTCPGHQCILFTPKTSSLEICFENPAEMICSGKTKGLPDSFEVQHKESEVAEASIELLPQEKDVVSTDSAHDALMSVRPPALETCSSDSHRLSHVRRQPVTANTACGCGSQMKGKKKNSRKIHNRGKKPGRKPLAGALEERPRKKGAWEGIGTQHENTNCHQFDIGNMVMLAKSSDGAQALEEALMSKNKAAIDIPNYKLVNLEEETMREMNTHLQVNCENLKSDSEEDDSDQKYYAMHLPYELSENYNTYLPFGEIVPKSFKSGL